MGSDCGSRKCLDLLGFGDIDAVHTDLSGTGFGDLGFGDLGGERLQTRLVAVGERKVAAARGELQRQGPANAARRRLSRRRRRWKSRSFRKLQLG